MPARLTAAGRSSTSDPEGLGRRPLHRPAPRRPRCPARASRTCTRPRASAFLCCATAPPTCCTTCPHHTCPHMHARAAATALAHEKQKSCDDYKLTHETRPAPRQATKRTQCEHLRPHATTPKNALGPLRDLHPAPHRAQAPREQPTMTHRKCAIAQNPITPPRPSPARRL